MPPELGYLAYYGFIDTETRNIRRYEKIRLASAVKRGILQREKWIKAVANFLVQSHGVTGQLAFNRQLPEYGAESEQNPQQHNQQYRHGKGGKYRAVSQRLQY